MKFTSFLISAFLCVTSSLAAAGIPTNNASLTRNEQEQSNALCKQATETEMAAIRRNAQGKGADAEKRAEMQANMYGAAGCSMNMNPPAFWQCVIDRQGRGESRDYATQQCRRD